MSANNNNTVTKHESAFDFSTMDTSINAQKDWTIDQFKAYGIYNARIMDKYNKANELVSLINPRVMLSQGDAEKENHRLVMAYMRKVNILNSLKESVNAIATELTGDTDLKNGKALYTANSQSWDKIYTERKSQSKVKREANKRTRLSTKEKAIEALDQLNALLSEK
jgi:hypothetical protein